MKLQGAQVVVIGGSSGIGLAAAKLARQEGADVTIAGRSQEKLAQAQRAVDIAKAQLLSAKARVEQAHAGVAAAHADVRQISMRTADAQGKIAKVRQARAALAAAERGPSRRRR